MLFVHGQNVAVDSEDQWQRKELNFSLFSIPDHNLSFIIEALQYHCSQFLIDFICALEVYYRFSDAMQNKILPEIKNLYIYLHWK